MREVLRRGRGVAVSSVPFLRDCDRVFRRLDMKPAGSTSR